MLTDRTTDIYIVLSFSNIFTIRYTSYVDIKAISAIFHDCNLYKYSCYSKYPVETSTIFLRLVNRNDFQLLSKTLKIK